MVIGTQTFWKDGFVKKGNRVLDPKEEMRLRATRDRLYEMMRNDTEGNMVLDPMK